MNVDDVCNMPVLYLSMLLDVVAQVCWWYITPNTTDRGSDLVHNTTLLDGLIHALFVFEHTADSVKICSFLAAPWITDWIQWNLGMMDILGAGILSFVGRLSLSQSSTGKPHPSMRRLNLLRGMVYKRLNQQFLWRNVQNRSKME